GDSDAAATLARTVTDPLTPMRKHRRDLPGTLDEVVLRGLARSRRQRWQNLEELRLALLPFVAQTHAVGEIGWRSCCDLCDALLLVIPELVVQRLLRALSPEVISGPARVLLSVMVASVLCGLAYFAIPEAVWGYTPGKWLMSLRVRDAATDDRPSLW